MPPLGQIVILNGPPRSGKSSIAVAIQERFDGVWMNIGVDHFMRMTPTRFLPGIGLRPGGERPDLEPLIVRLYRALYEAAAAHSRLGVNVVEDIAKSVFAAVDQFSSTESSSVKPRWTKNPRAPFLR